MRTKEAIATVRGFCKHQARGENGDPFAKGILAALRWMTEQDSPCPYAELVEDLDDNGGWLETTAAPAPAPAPQEPAQSHLPTTKMLFDPANPPAPDDPPRLVLPDSLSAHLEAQPWLRAVVEEVSDLQRSHGGAGMRDHNSVVVGQGLKPGPVLAGVDDYGDDGGRY